MYHTCTLGTYIFGVLVLGVHSVTYCTCKVPCVVYSLFFLEMIPLPVVRLVLSTDPTVPTKTCTTALQIIVVMMSIPMCVRVSHFFTVFCCLFFVGFLILFPSCFVLCLHRVGVVVHRFAQIINHFRVAMVLRPSFGVLVSLVETCFVVQISPFLVQMFYHVQVSLVSGVF